MIVDQIEKKIQYLKKNKYQLPIKEILSQTFSLFTKTLFLGIFSVIFTSSVLVLVYQFFTSYFDLADLDSTIYQSYMVLLNTFVKGDVVKSQEALMGTRNLLFSYLSNFCVMQRFIILIFSKIIIFPLSAGVVYCAYKKDTVGLATFKDLIRNFEGQRFLNLVILGVIYYIAIAISIVFFYLPMLIFSPFLYLAGAFIAINNISLGKALKYSIQIAKINYGKMLMISLLSFVLSTIIGQLFGFMLLYALSVPFTLVMVYVVYKNILGEDIISNE